VRKITEQKGIGMKTKAYLLPMIVTAALLFSGCAGTTTLKPESNSQCAKKVISKELGMISCEDKEGLRKWQRPLTNYELRSYLNEEERKTVLKNRAEEKTKLAKSAEVDKGIAVASVVLLSPAGMIYSASKHGQRQLVEEVDKAGGWNTYALKLKKKYGE
jgi:hypothetical protein